VLPLSTSKPRRWARLGVAAAIFVLLGGLAIWTVLPRFGRSGPQQPVTGTFTEREFVTARGQRMAFRLPDGSSVVLGPASRLQILGEYNARDRAVALVGEGAFTVTHDAARPFVVYTPHGVAKDLGTRFVVREYGDDSSTVVVVAEGAVALGGRTGRPGVPVALRPGQLGRVDADGAVEVRHGVDLDRHFAWTEGRLVFRDTPLRDAAAQLARWYDVEIRLASPVIAGRHLTASAKDEPPGDVLTMIAVSLSLDLEVSGAGRVFTLRPR
jgi:ferric-dicitrate binding protein FerR (iron transport regulator)